MYLEARYTQYLITNPWVKNEICFFRNMLCFLGKPFFLQLYLELRFIRSSQKLHNFKLLLWLDNFLFLAMHYCLGSCLFWILILSLVFAFVHGHVATQMIIAALFLSTTRPCSLTPQQPVLLTRPRLAARESWVNALHQATYIQHKH